MLTGLAKQAKSYIARGLYCYPGRIPFERGPFVVIPAKAGIQSQAGHRLVTLDPRFRGDDGRGRRIFPDPDIRLAIDKRL